MGWRDEKRSAILTALSSKSRLYRSRIDAFSLETECCAASSVEYEIACATIAVDQSTFRIVIDSRTESPSFCVDSIIVPSNLSGAYRRVVVDLCANGALLTNDDIAAQSAVVGLQIEIGGIRDGLVDDTMRVVVHVVALAIGSGFRGFTFNRERREHHLFGNAERQRAGVQVRASAAKQPPSPPGHDKLSLEERLRWILTPPIHEILTDPQLTLPAHPFPYQSYGIKWLMDRENALLADEMGLGKTMQAILAARLLWRQQRINRILIVCPKPLISTWQEEIGKWWPSAIQNTRLAGMDRRFFLKLGTDNVTIKIINYEALAKEADWLKDQRFTHDLIIIDEAQRIKTPKTASARAVKALNGPRRWALTGTPLENRIEDVLSIFDFIRPGLLEWDDPEYVRDRIKPFFLRRRADEVLPELPEKDDQDVPVTLESRQREAYDGAERDGVVQLNDKGDTVTVQHVFALIKRLMQICNCEPVSGESAKLDRIRGDLEEIIASGRKVLIFSQFVSEPFGLKRLRTKLPSFCKAVEMHGEIPEHGREAAKRSFNADPSTNTMLLHYRVGGVGLNLQAANYVYLFDRWWNPAVEDQAVKRAHRLGQQNKVFIRRLYCKDTIEERILQKLAEKRRLFSQVIEEDRPEAMGLSEEEVFALFPGLRVRPKRPTKAAAPPRIVLDKMDPYQFEELVAKIYECHGYTVKLIGGSHDGGVDIIAEKPAVQGRERVVIQCKHQKGSIGRPELQKLWGVVCADASITRGEFVTSSEFTAQARQFANGKRITLISRDQIVHEAERLGVARFATGI